MTSPIVVECVPWLMGLCRNGCSLVDFQREVARWTRPNEVGSDMALLYSHWALGLVWWNWIGVLFGKEG
jgi:hypothetical protein